MKIASVKTIREIEKKAIEEYMIPDSVLMENAATAFVHHIDISKDYYIVVCGTGNNGGDGLSIARHLSSMGKEVDVFIISNKDSVCSDLFVLNLRILKNYDVNIYEITESKQIWDFKEALWEADIVIDALFGIGLTRQVKGIHKEAIEALNECSNNIVSVDVPSGINADSGEVMGLSVKAEKTVTFILYKKGFLNYNCSDYLGDVIVDNISLPGKLLEVNESVENILDHEYVISLIPKRSKTGYKGNYGKILIVAGSTGFTGANKITSEATLATGAGLVTVSSNKDVFNEISQDVREAMSIHPDKIETAVETSNVIAFGPGMGKSKDTYILLMRVIKKLHDDGLSDTTLVLDADGLNVLEGRADFLQNIGVKVIITPHMGEMARLTGQSIEYVQKNRIEVAKKFAKKHKVIVVLKGHNSVITDGNMLYINPTGSSAIASGGMGDCLTGIISGIAGQVKDPMQAAVLGVYLHGYIGDTLARQRYAVSASEIIEKIPFEMKNLQDEKEQ